MNLNPRIIEIQKNPIVRALDPQQRFLEVRFLPPSLNPFVSEGVEIAALIPFMVFPHIKTIPTWRMMFEDFDLRLYEGKHTIIVPSSGNTAHAVARLAPVFGFKKVKVIMSTDVPDSKSGILKAFGSVDVMQVSDVMTTAFEEARKEGHYLLDQYSHMGNMRAHELYTGPEIVRALGGAPAIVGIVLGSGGTIGGVSRFLHEKYPETSVIGVRPILGQQVPGARDEVKMKAVVTLPWATFVTAVVELSRKDSFIRMRKLWSAVEPQPGPTSGLAWGGLERYVKSILAERPGSLRGKCVAFICPDDGRFYPERTTGELDTHQGL